MTHEGTYRDWQWVRGKIVGERFDDVKVNFSEAIIKMNLDYRYNSMVQKTNENNCLYEQ